MWIAVRIAHFTKDNACVRRLPGRHLIADAGNGEAEHIEAHAEIADRGRCKCCHKIFRRH